MSETSDSDSKPNRWASIFKAAIVCAGGFKLTQITANSNPMVAVIFAVLTCVALVYLVIVTISVITK